MRWINSIIKNVLTVKEIQDPVNVERISQPIDIAPSANPRIPMNSSLIFKEVGFGSGEAVTVSYDGIVYCVRRGGNFTRINDITDPESTEQGIAWNRDEWGLPEKIAVTNQGICVTTRDEDASPKIARVLFFEDINDDTPTIVKEIADDNIYYAKGFGLDSYSNGLTSMVLIGEYGSGNVERKAYLSLDGGETFSDVYTVGPFEDAVNTHIHDVAISPNGHLWLSVGDHVDLDGVYRSIDLGATWEKLPSDVPRAPTAIMPFCDRVVFGRDDAQLEPGFDYYNEPIKSADWDMDESSVFGELRSVIPNEASSQSQLFMLSPVYNGGLEGYCRGPRSANEIGDYPSGMWGTGDGGVSIHRITTNINSLGDEIVIRGITNDYLIASRSSTLMYAKKPIWVTR